MSIRNNYRDKNVILVLCVERIFSKRKFNEKTLKSVDYLLLVINIVYQTYVVNVTGHKNVD